MPMEHYFIRSKEELAEINILMVVSHMQVLSINENGVVTSVSSNYSHSEEFPLDNIPRDISNLETVRIKITPSIFDHLRNLYENDIKKFLYYNPDNKGN